MDQVLADVSPMPPAVVQHLQDYAHDHPDEWLQLWHLRKTDIAHTPLEETLVELMARLRRRAPSTWTNDLLGPHPMATSPLYTTATDHEAIALCAHATRACLAHAHSPDASLILADVITAARQCHIRHALPACWEKACTVPAESYEQLDMLTHIWDSQLHQANRLSLAPAVPRNADWVRAQLSTSECSSASERWAPDSRVWREILDKAIGSNQLALLGYLLRRVDNTAVLGALVDATRTSNPLSSSMLAVLLKNHDPRRDVSLLVPRQLAAQARAVELDQVLNAYPTAAPNRLVGELMDSWIHDTKNITTASATQTLEVVLSRSSPDEVLGLWDNGALDPKHQALCTSKQWPSDENPMHVLMNMVWDRMSPQDKAARATSSAHADIPSLRAKMDALVLGDAVASTIHKARRTKKM